MTDDQQAQSTPGEPVLPGEEGMRRQEDEASGAEVPGVDVGTPDALPPDDPDAVTFGDGGGREPGSAPGSSEP
jgi:hypothetical protein